MSNQKEADRLSVLAHQIRMGWGSMPPDKIPANWREVRGPGDRVPHKRPKVKPEPTPILEEETIAKIREGTFSLAERWK
jgi:hypothetical protein